MAQKGKPIYVMIEVIHDGIFGKKLLGVAHMPLQALRQMQDTQAQWINVYEKLPENAMFKQVQKQMKKKPKLKKVGELQINVATSVDALVQ